MNVYLEDERCLSAKKLLRNALSLSRCTTETQIWYPRSDLFRIRQIPKRIKGNSRSAVQVPYIDACSCTGTGHRSTISVEGGGTIGRTVKALAIQGRAPPSDWGVVAVWASGTEDQLHCELDTLMLI